MRDTLLFLLLPILLALALLTDASGDELPSNRAFHRLGVSVGVVSEPFPSLWGASIGYNATDWFRASLGYGEASVKGISIETASVHGALLVPGWNLSPSLGAGMAYSHLNARPSTGLIDSVDGRGSYLYSSLGLEWQSARGLNVGVGYRFFLPWNGGLPGAQLGYYF